MKENTFLTRSKILEDNQDYLIDSVITISQVFIEVINKGGKLIFAGNGGSAAEAQHMSAEYVGTLVTSNKRDPIPSIALSVDTSFITAWSNDNVDLRNDLLAEMRGRIKEDESTVPARDGDYEYATRYEHGGQHPIFTRRNTAGLETVLLHGDKEAEGQSFFRIGGCTHSTDHKML